MRFRHKVILEKIQQTKAPAATGTEDATQTSLTAQMPQKPKYSHSRRGLITTRGAYGAFCCILLRLERSDENIDGKNSRS